MSDTGEPNISNYVPNYVYIVKSKVEKVTGKIFRGLAGAVRICFHILCMTSMVSSIDLE